MFKVTDHRHSTEVARTRACNGGGHWSVPNEPLELEYRAVPRSQICLRVIYTYDTKSHLNVSRQ